MRHMAVQRIQSSGRREPVAAVSAAEAPAVEGGA